MITVTLPDGAQLKFDSPLSAYKVAETIGAGLAKAALIAKVNDTPVDLSHTISADCSFSVTTTRDAEAEELLRHSCAHIMAAAVRNLYPDAKFGIGPAIENGFYYDFDLEHKFTPEDLPIIEAEMQRIIESAQPYTRIELTREQAIERFAAAGQNLKVELLKELAEPVVSIYTTGQFEDLCRGPHIPNTAKAPSFKLMSVAGAYWRGDVNNKMLQRIYAVAFADKKQLKSYITMLEEAKKRDHRKIGKEMDLFSFQLEGPGFPFFHPNGTAVLNQIISYWREEHAANGYSEIMTPTMLDCRLWRQSGHYDNYAENMYFTTIDEREFALKPMNCPGAMLVYKTSVRSYKELPLRIAEMGRVHRHELSGVMHGLFRVRAFSIDDAHIFCTEEQAQDEILGLIKFIGHIYETFGFEKWIVELSTRPPKYIGSIEVWDKATQMLRNAMEAAGLSYHVEEGGGAFYGPKIDFKILDSIGRLWQCGTIQVDFSMPSRFELEYTGADGKLHTPVLLHRALLGSLERFFGILVEDTAGKFPLWLAPVQARIMTVTDASRDYAQKLFEQLRREGLRVDSDLRNEKIGYKIRAATVENVPYMLVIGESEAENGTAALRHRTIGDLGPKQIAEIVAGIRAEVARKSKESFWQKASS